MPVITIIVGGLLSAIGVMGFALGTSKSLTSLIPLAFGTLLELCGVLAMRPAMKKHAMHGASMLALLGVAGSAMGAVRFVQHGGDTPRPLSTTMQLAMFIICLAFLILCIRSFRDARARRLAESGR